MAVEEGYGWCPATSAQIASGYPDKVLATSERFYSYRPDEYLRLIEVLHEACAFCESVDQRAEVLNILSKPEYLNCTPQTLAHGFSSAFPMGDGRIAEGPFLSFQGEGVDRPDGKRAQQVLDDLIRYMPHEKLERVPKGVISRVYREDLYDQAMQRVSAEAS